MWHTHRTVTAGAIAVMLTVVSGPAFAAWPEKTVTVVVPYAAGGNTDIMARLVTDWLSNRLGQRFIVENRVGAGATLGRGLCRAGQARRLHVPVRRSAPAPDRAAGAEGELRRAQGFRAGRHLRHWPAGAGLSASVPAKNLRELIAYAKANPGKISYASGGVGTAAHLTGALLAARAGPRHGARALQGRPAGPDRPAGRPGADVFRQCLGACAAQDQRQGPADRRVALEAHRAASGCRGGGEMFPGLQPRGLEWLCRAAGQRRARSSNCSRRKPRRRRRTARSCSG